MTKKYKYRVECDAVITTVLYFESEALYHLLVAEEALKMMEEIGVPEDFELHGRGFKRWGWQANEVELLDDEEVINERGEVSALGADSPEGS